MRFALVVAMLLAVPAMTLGASITMKVGGETELVALPGDTLAVDIYLEGLEVRPSAFDGFMVANQAGVLGLAGRTWGAQGFNGFPAVVSEDEDEEEGRAWPWAVGTEPDLFGSLGGMRLSGTATLSSLANPVVTYNLKISESWDGSTLIVDLVDPKIADAGAQPILPIEGGRLVITPEPASLLLLGLGGLFLRRRRA